MKCPQCNGAVFEKQLEHINEFEEHYELFFTNRCGQCGCIFSSKVRARIESEMISEVDGEIVYD